MSAVPMSASKALNENVGTFTYEQSLPKLPLPELSRTLDEFNRSLQPLYYSDGYCNHVEQDQLESFSHDVDEFSKSSVAEKLQRKLREFDLKNDCYLDNIHLDINDTTFKDGQDDLLPRNPFLVLADDAQPEISQADRSAVLVHSALRFASALRHGVLTPDVNTRSGCPLSMRAYRNLFGATRCPVFASGEVENFDLDKPYSESDLDEIWLSTDDEADDSQSQLSSMPPSTAQSAADSSTPGPDGDVFTCHGIVLKRYPESKHILVISKGQYYTVEVLDQDNDLIYNAGSLATVFDHILEDSREPNTFKKSTALGSLTSYSFRNWKYARKRLQKKYPDELYMIDSALFVLVLDESFSHESESETTSLTTSEDCKRLFYGTSVIDDRGHQVGSCISRWYDKLQLIVTADSKAAVIWDSFTCDGSVVLRFTSETYTESVLRLARDVNAGDPRFSLWPSVKDSGKLVPANSEIDPKTIVKKIVWDFSHILNTHVHLSETKLADLISKHDIYHVAIPFGRRSAQRLGINPDSMIQIALQVAHYALYGRMVYGLEPISTRGYKNSRSCFINIQSEELLELCQEFISNALDESGKLRKFREACSVHSDKIRKAKRGDSYEKHYNALKYLYKFHEHFGIELDGDDKRIAEQVFDNSLVTPFSAPELIVANCGNAATTTFGITPAVSQGFGIGYIIKDDQCDLTVTSQFRQGDRLMYMLNWVLTEIRGFWKKTNQSPYNPTGVKISPVVDKLYEMDNALNSLKSSRKNGSSKVIRGYGFFDMQGHVDSRSSSRINSQNNSSVQLSEMTSNLSLNNGSMHFSKHSSVALSVPTDKEKQDTGHEIQQIHPLDKNESDEELLFTESRAATKRRNNVINSKFEIDFDRSGVGRKVKATFE